MQFHRILTLSLVLVLAVLAFTSDGGTAVPEPGK